MSTNSIPTALRKHGLFRDNRTIQMQRIEAKLDRLMRELLPRQYADTIISELDKQYPKT